jgi:hypothetical protein
MSAFRKILYGAARPDVNGESVMPAKIRKEGEASILWKK